MSLHHFFLDDQVIADQPARCFPLHLSDADFKHAKVARLSLGEHIAVIDADHDYFECKIEGIGPEGLTVSVAGRIEASAPSGQVTLLQGMAKGEKMDTVIRQATELGVSSIVPLICERSVVKLSADKTAKRVARWRAVCKSAAMQSGRMDIPDVSAPASVSEAAAALSGLTAVIVCWEEADGSAGIGSAIKKACRERKIDDSRQAHVAVAVGPEGGFAPFEVDALCAGNDCSAIVGMGSTILRTETAGVVASALALYELGGLGGRDDLGEGRGYPCDLP